jgi:hypothetical protein
LLKNHSEEVIDTESRKIQDGICSCNAFHKFGHCIHIVILDKYLGVGSRRLVRRPYGSRRGSSQRRGVMGQSSLSNLVATKAQTRGPRGRPRKQKPFPSTKQDEEDDLRKLDLPFHWNN